MLMGSCDAFGRGNYEDVVDGLGTVTFALSQDTKSGAPQ